MLPLASRLAAQQSSMFTCAYQSQHLSKAIQTKGTSLIAAVTYVIVSEGREAGRHQSLSCLAYQSLVDVPLEVGPVYGDMITPFHRSARSGSICRVLKVGAVPAVPALQRSYGIVDEHQG